MEDSSEIVKNALAVEAVESLRAVRGTQYEVGTWPQVMYAASGTSDDYAKGYLGLKYAYTVELPGGGTAGFDLPASEVLPVVTETFEAIKTYGANIAKIN